MSEDNVVSNGTFHVNVKGKDKLIYVSYDNKWYQLELKKVDSLYDSHKKGQDLNVRISPESMYSRCTSVGILNPLEYVLKYYAIDE